MIRTDLTVVQKNPSEDLTKVKFGKYPLGFEFVPAYNAEVPVDNTGRWSQRNAPDGIRFEPHRKLIDIIQKTPVPLHKFPGDSCLRGKCEIPAKNAKDFLNSIEKIQKISGLCITPKKLDQLLSALQQNKYITPEEAATWKSHIFTSPTLEDYEEEAEKTRDPNKAIAIAYYYRDTDDFMNSLSRGQAIRWLCRAKEYLKGQNLSELVNLQGFLCKFQEIDSIYPFRTGEQEVIRAIADGSTVEKLSFTHTDYEQTTANAIGACLERTSSIKKVQLSGPLMDYNTERINDQTVAPIAKALQINTSVEALDLNNTRVGDLGVSLIVDALERNPKLRMAELNFASCPMTDESAKKLLALIKKRDSFRLVNLYNTNVSGELRKEIQSILNKRAKALSQE